MDSYLRPVFAYRNILFLLAIFFLFSCTGSDSEISINPGKVYGTISFTNTNAEIVNYLSGNAVTEYSSDTDSLYLPVKLLKPGTQALHSASLYTADNTAIDSQTYQAAHYENFPNIEATSEDLLLVIQNLNFSNGASYRFGSAENTSPAKRLCSNIMPVTDVPAGTQCDIGECPSLLNLQLQFEVHPLYGDPADLDAIDDQAVFCYANVFIEDTPGSGAYNLQAESGSYAFSRDELINGTAQIPVLTRSSDIPVRVDVSCSAKIKPGESGFVVIPASGRTPFSGRRMLSSTACGGTPTEHIGIIVDRAGGALQGYFDISGHEESMAKITFDPQSNNSYLFTIDALPVPASSTPTEKWRFEGVPAGVHALLGKAVVDGGNNKLTLPILDGANQPVTVLGAPFVTDTGSRLISGTQQVNGAVYLFDQTGITNLENLVTVPFEDFWSGYTSFISASGYPGMIPGGASGTGGMSESILSGTFNTTTNQGLYNYSMLLTGISAENAATDGSETKATPWDINTLNLYIDNSTQGTQSINISPSLYMHYIAHPGEDNPITQPDLSFCFGKYSTTINVPESLGTIFHPSIYAYGQSPYESTVASSTPELVTTHAYGTPSSSDSAQSQAKVEMTLPEGFQYSTYPSIRLIPPGGSVNEWSYLSLGRINIPEDSVISCGSGGSTCLDVLETDGTYNRLSIDITDSTGTFTPNYCLTDGNLSLNINVNSDGLNVNRVAYVVDPPSTDTDCDTASTQVLCTTGCGIDPAFPVTLTGLSNGPHSIKVCATSQTGCIADSTYSFNVDSEPAQLQCPADFSVDLAAGESSIPASDPRIADNLNAQVSGYCGVPISITDDRPATFVTGLQDVHFSTTATDSCTTSVTLNEFKDHQLAYLTDNGGAPQLRVHNITSNTQAYSFPIFGEFSERKLSYSFDRSGQRLGISGNNYVVMLDAETGVNLSSSTPSNNTHHSISFNPDDNDKYAIASQLITYETDAAGNETENIDHVEYAIRVLNGTTLVNSFTLPVIPTMGIPELEWSGDGTTLFATYIQPYLENSTVYTVHVDLWPIPYEDMELMASLAQLKDNNPREELYEVVRLPDNKIYYVTNRGTSSISTSGVNWVTDFPNNDMDMAEETGAAIAIYSVNNRYKMFLLSDATLPSGGTITTGPYIGGPSSADSILPGINPGKPQVAISPDGEFAALALTDRIAVFRLPDLTTVVTEIMADRPGNLQFRPMGP